MGIENPVRAHDVECHAWSRQICHEVEGVEVRRLAMDIGPCIDFHFLPSASDGHILQRLRVLGSM